jgi:hypothetical protein
MTSAWELSLRLFHLGLLRCAALLAPRRQRVEWWREWHAELWHVRRACAPASTVSWPAAREITAFCLGAFQDAFCLRRNGRPHTRPFAPSRGSAAQCILVLAGAAAASSLAALLLPGVRAELRPPPYEVRPGVILIQNARSGSDSVATIPFEEFQIWKERRQRYFDSLAFYRVRRETVFTEAGSRIGLRAGSGTGWKVAHASSNLFALLGLPIRFQQLAGGASANLPGVILSEEAWNRDFSGDPHIAGSVMRVGQRLARIVGVAPRGAWSLPGDADAWLLEQNSAMYPDGKGYVLGHLTREGQSEMWTSRVQIVSHNSDGSEDYLWGVSFAQRKQGAWNIYLFTVLLAFLALPAVTSVSLGEYSFSTHRPSWSSRVGCWGFLAAKAALLLPIAYFSSLDFAYWDASRHGAASEYVQLAASFSICLFGMRWVLLDQRGRCPVCLRRVSNPARVGLASRTFLAWNGTELICQGGHTLLHVPGAPTSWFSTQRWLYLDPSWEFLFAGSRAG